MRLQKFVGVCTDRDLYFENSAMHANLACPCHNDGHKPLIALCVTECVNEPNEHALELVKQRFGQRTST